MPSASVQMLEFVYGSWTASLLERNDEAVTPETTDIPVTIVSTDRSQLCELSWTLSLFGYRPTASCDFGDENPWQRSSEPQIVLVDVRSEDDAEEVLAAPRTHNYVYRIAIDSMESENTCERLLARGADDVIRHPVNLGELLTRLRTGVRRLEFERRLALRERHDPLTGAMSREALIHWLERRQTANQTLPQSLVVCGVDYLDLIREQNGVRAQRHVSATLGRCLTQSLNSDERCAVLDHGVFAALLNRPAEEARTFAESLAASFAASDTLVREIRLLPSLSAMVADWNPALLAAQQLDEARSTFEHLQCCGGNCVRHADELRQQIAQWRNNIDEGVPFEDVIAQDMMEMFPIVLTEEQLQVGFGADITSPEVLQVPCIPVVDSDGHLTGAVQARQLASPASVDTLSQPATIEHVQTLSEMFDAFTVADEGHLVVVDGDNRPLGYLSCEGLASLVLDRIDADRYRPAKDASEGLSSLVVPVEPSPEQGHEPAVAT